MPIYEYECQACGHTLDALQKISDGPLRKCPECQRLKLKKLMSAPKFRLKGEGWYETDFKSDNRRNLADNGDAPASDKSSDAKSDGAKEGAKSGDGKSADGKSGTESASKEKSAKTSDTKTTGKTGKHKSGSKSGDGKAA